jgi:putrescine importer
MVAKRPRSNLSVPAAEPASGVPVQRLRRVLTLWDLIFYGIVAVTPSAPATVYGLAELKSGGYVVVTILAAMVAMVLTAISYGRMAALYPSAGSAYAYVSRGIHPYLGFVAGWAMLLDYMLIPLFCTLYGTLALQRALPVLPFPIGSILFAGGITLLNLRGIRSTARANQVLLVFMGIVLFSFIVLAIKYIAARYGIQGLFSIQPFYRPGTFHLRAIASATSFAALTYLGFDAVTTMAEDVKDPRKNVLLAAVSVCLFTGVFGGLLVYLGHLAWPDYTTFTNVNTAFIDVTGRVGGVALLKATAVLLVVANVGAGLTSQVGAARLLYGMGRENVIPARYFARLHPTRNTPDINIILLGVLGFVGAQFISYELAAELLNFGAFLGFMGVNVAVIWQFWVRRAHQQGRNFLTDVILPFLGFLFCSVIWLGLGNPAKIAGSLWLLVGFFVLATQTGWFRRPVVMSDPSSYE